MTLLADRHIPWLEDLLPADVVLLRFDGGRPPSDLLRQADALLIRTVTRVDATLLKEAPRLRWLGTATAGFDHIDVAAVDEAGVDLYVAAGCNASAVGDYVDRVTTDVPMNRLAIVGYGHTGKAVADRMRRRGVDLLLYDPPQGLPATWDDVLACDAVTFHVPLTSDGPHPTRKMVTDSDFDRAGWTTLVQASRGGVVDENALKTWIRRGGTAFIDVWEDEPAIDAELCALAALATPHIAGYSVQAKFRATRMCVEALGLTVDSFRLTVDAQRVTPENPLQSLSNALKASPSAATFKHLRNNSPLRVEAE